jgi:hypothetical protein
LRDGASDEELRAFERSSKLPAGDANDAATVGKKRWQADKLFLRWE